MLLGHVPRPAWSPAYAAAAAAAAYYRYAVSSLPSPCSSSPFVPQFPPAGYLGVSDPLTSVGGYCGSFGARRDDVDRCLKTLRCSLNNPPLHSTPTTSWHRSRGNRHHCLSRSYMWNKIVATVFSSRRMLRLAATTFPHECFSNTIDFTKTFLVINTV